MPHDLEASVIRILNTAGETVGAGFLVAERLAVTCAHVIGECEKTVEIQFCNPGSDKQIAKVLSRGWSDVNADDVAFLELENQPPMARPVTLGSTDHCPGHDYLSLGFPDFGDYRARWSQGNLGGMVPSGNQRQPLLQLQGEEIDKGCSGGPVLDRTDDRVVGMITEYRDSDLTRFAYATIAETLQSPWPELRLLPPGYDRVRLASYLQDVQNRYQYIDLKGIPLPRYRLGQPINLRPSLDQVYIRLQAVEEKHQRQQETGKSRFLEQQLKNQATASPNEFKNEILSTLRLLGEYFYRRGLVFQTEKRPEPVDPQTALEQHRRLVILGAPGSGKSTLLRFLALQAARDPQGPVPILILLREYAAALAGDRTLTLREFALREVTAGDDTLYRTLKIEIAAGRILWLVDALDEARGWSAKVAEQLNELPGHLVITSRPLGYISPPAALPEFEVLPFTPENTDDFLQRWFTFLAEVRETGPDWVEQRKDWLKKQLQDRPLLQPLARNPLLLTFLAILAGEERQRDLPVGRTELYRRYIEELLGSWEKERYPRKGVLGEPAVKIGPLKGQTALKYAEICLDYLGWSLHLTYFGGQSQSIPNRPYLIKKLADYLQHHSPGGLPDDSEEIAKGAIEFWQEAGLLDTWRLNDEEYLIFRHLTFEEYTTAQILKQAWQKNPRRTWKFLRPRLHHYAWREPILLFAGLLDAAGLADLIHRITAAVSPYEHLLARDLRLAIAIVGEWPDLNAALTQAVFGGIAKVYASLPDTSWQRNKILAALKQIGKPAIPALIQFLALSHTHSPLIFSLSGDIIVRYDHKVVSALIEIHDPQVVSALIELLENYCRGNPVFFQSDGYMGAIAALGKIGDCKAIPVLQKALAGASIFIRRSTVVALENIGDSQITAPLMRQLVGDSDEFIRRCAVDALGKIGDSQINASLMQQLVGDSDKWVRLNAAKALKDIGNQQAAIPALLQLLENDDWGIHETAALALAEIGDSRAIPVLLRIAKDKYRSAVETAIEALGRISDPCIVPILLNLLSESMNSCLNKKEHTEAEANSDCVPNSPCVVRRAAAKALGEIGDPRAIPYLLQVIKYRDKEFNSISPYYALMEIRNPKSKTVSSSVLRGADTLFSESIKSVSAPWAAALALGKIDDPGVVRALLGVFNDSDEIGWCVAADALRRIDDPQLIPYLVQVLNEENGYSRYGRAWAARILRWLCNSQKVIKEVIPVLLGALKDRSWYVRFEAAEALRLIGDRQAISALIQTLQDRSKDVRIATIRALQKIGDVRAIPALIQALQDRSREVRIAAIEALFGINDARAIPALIQALQDRSWYMRMTAAMALEKIGNSCAVDDLAEALGDRNWRVRWAAASALGKIGDSKVVPILLWALGDYELRVRIEVIDALGKIGDPQAVPALLQLLDAPPTLTEKQDWLIKNLKQPRDAIWNTGLLRLPVYLCYGVLRSRITSALKEISIKSNSVTITKQVAKVFERSTNRIIGGSNQLEDIVNRMAVLEADATTASDPFLP